VTVTSPADQFRAARDRLLALRDDYQQARRDFRWPRLDTFNWALDHIDRVGRDPASSGRTALWIVQQDGQERRWTFAQLAERSDQVARWLREQGVGRGDRLLLMLGNQIELWETLLAAMKLGAVVIPATTQLGPAEIADRVRRGQAGHVVVAAGDTGKFAGVAGGYTRIAVGEPVAGWLAYDDTRQAATDFLPDGPTRGSDPLLLYFTSGTTARPKLVEHTHTSYPVGHLTTMYWLGVRPGDVHLNISSPGWAKHAWSNVFAPWNAEATVFLYSYDRFDADALLDVLARCAVTTFCAPPTVWRMLIQADLQRVRVPLREAVAAGEPLNPEVIARVADAWGLQIRDGFGQTETTVLVANTPGQPVKPGSMGRPAPGYHIELLDPATGRPTDEGEICVALEPRPVGLLTGYRDDPERTAEVMAGGYYHTGDVAAVDGDGYLTYVGRADDVLKSSDYRISPFELESVLLEHPAVAEVAVVPAPDPLRHAVPKAYVVLAAGHPPTRETAAEIFRFARTRLPAYQRVRRLEFADLPKTISGKIRRVELRQREAGLHGGPGAAPAGEYRDADFPELRET
jgi:acetyl-CoA synthetase